MTLSDDQTSCVAYLSLVDHACYDLDSSSVSLGSLELRFSNTNRLIRKADWDISLSKTGFTSDAGNCLVMKITLGNRPLIVVLLNSWGKLSKYGDSNRIKRWILSAEAKVRRMNLI